MSSCPKFYKKLPLLCQYPYPYLRPCLIGIESVYMHSWQQETLARQGEQSTSSRQQVKFHLAGWLVGGVPIRGRPRNFSTKYASKNFKD